MRAFAISLYDKFDELELLVEIIRENFEEDYFISVCCHHKEGREEIIERREIDINEYKKGSEIPYKPKKMNSVQKDICLNSRILDSFRKSCQAALEKERVDSVIHLHADAWVLDESLYDNLIEIKEKTDSSILARGLGIGCRNNDLWIGHLMDQFMLLDKSVMSYNLFDFKTSEILPHVSLHTSLMILIQGKIGLSELHFYDDMQKDLDYDGKRKKNTSLHPIVRPSIENEKLGIVHVAKEDFPNNYGEELQTFYLKKYNISEGEEISKAISKYDKEIDKIIQDLYKEEKKLDLKLRMIGFNPKDFNRKLNKKKDVLNRSKLNLLKKSVNNWAKNLFVSLIGALTYLIRMNTRRFELDKKKRYTTIKSEWPYGKVVDRLENKAKIDNRWPEHGQKEKAWFKNQFEYEEILKK